MQHTYYHLDLLFSQPRWIQSEFFLCFRTKGTLSAQFSSFSLIHPLPVLCVHVCVRVLKPYTGAGPLPHAHPLPHKCEGIVNISAADGADAPSPPPLPDAGRAEQMDSINSSRSSPGPRPE